MTYISVLNKYKEQMQSGSFKATFNEFSSLINQRWSELELKEAKSKVLHEAIFNTAINSQIQDQIDLMAMVQKIHRNEQSIEIQKLFKSGTSFKKALSKAKYDGRAYGIYLLAAKTEGSMSETIVIGDLHSDTKSLQAALQAVDFFNKVVNGQPIRIIFMGDYVDRGKEHLQIIDWILALKYVFSKQIFILRGNHDGGFIENNGIIKTPYRIPDEDNPLIYFPMLIRAIELQNPSIMESVLPYYLNFFESLAMIAAFEHHEKVYLACHGGILRPVIASPICIENEQILDIELISVLEPDLLLPEAQWYDYIDDLTCLTRADELDEIGRSRIQNIFWSDPTDKNEDLKWNTGRFQFTENHFRAYSSKLEFDVLLRGHQEITEGIQEQFNGDCKTIYSTGGQLLMGENKASAYQEVFPKVGVITDAGFEARRI